MRSLFSFLFAAFLLQATGQPQVPDFAFTGVRDAKGRALHIAPLMNEADRAVFWKEQSLLQEARILHVNADTVQLSITGRILLTGGCASNMPLFGLEMFTDSGWVERVPLELTQLDCGMSWGDWEERSLLLPLRSWTGAHAPAGRKELVPGTYRLLFMGADMQRVATAAFRID